MNFHAKKCIGVLAVAALALPLWAGSSSHTDSTPFDAVQTAKIGQTQLQPGHYTLKAKESGNQLEILQEGKLIATVPCSWVELPQKAKNSEVLSSKNQVTQVEFRGRTEAVKIG
jgi:hypothetical protein